MLDLMGNGSHRPLISNVYYDNALRQAYVNLYVNVYDDHGKAVGIERASLSLSSVWDAVNSEFNAGTRDYSMVIDNHDVCIAYTTTDTTQGALPAELFKSLAPLPATFVSQIKQEDLYDPTQPEVAVYNNSGDLSLSNLTQSTNLSAVTAQQFQPAGQSEQYEVVKSTDQLLSWSYVVLRPMSTITSAANQQVLYLFLISLVVTLLAAVIGLFVGRGITRPIQRSVDTLRDNSDSLKQLASAEEATAMEQKWIIDSSQIGLQSVQYYANATGSAAQQLNAIGENLLLNWGRLDSAQTKQGLDDIITAARYIEKAAEHQKKSCGGLNDAIQVTAQVTDQLVTGATSASDAATQLDKVVFELREVVGK
jgi:methyl-accepting chemotaxis protein